MVLSILINLWYLENQDGPEYPELKTFEWDILNLDQLFNLEINNKRRTSII